MWPITTLGEVTYAGQYGLNAAALKEGSGVRFIRITDIDATGRLGGAAPAYVDGSVTELGQYILSPGDLLIARSGATAGKSLLFAGLLEPAVFAGYLIRFKVRVDRALPEYLAHFMKSPSYWGYIRKTARAVAQPNVNARELASIPVPLPPLSDQRRIVELLSRAENIVRTRLKAEQKTKEIIPALFLDMFGDPGMNPKGWNTCELGNVCTRITDGTHQPPAFTSEGIPFLFVANIVKGAINFDTEKFIAKSTHQELTRRCPIERGDILYSTVGSYGVPVKVDTDRAFSFQRHISHIKPDHDLINTDFLVGMLLTPALKAQAESVARGGRSKDGESTGYSTVSYYFASSGRTIGFRKSRCSGACI